MTEYVWIVQNEDAEIVFVSANEHGWHEWLRNERGIAEYKASDVGMVSDHDDQNLVTRTMVEYMAPDSIFDIPEMMTVECWIVSRPIND